MSKYPHFWQFSQQIPLYFYCFCVFLTFGWGGQFITLVSLFIQSWVNFVLCIPNRLYYLGYQCNNASFVGYFNSSLVLLYLDVLIFYKINWRLLSLFHLQMLTFDANDIFIECDLNLEVFIFAICIIFIVLLAMVSVPICLQLFLWDTKILFFIFAMYFIQSKYSFHAELTNILSSSRHTYWKSIGWSFLKFSTGLLDPIRVPSMNLINWNETAIMSADP